MKHTKLHVYADDTQVYKSFSPKDTGTAISEINEDLSAIATWATDRALILNPKKYLTMLLGQTQQRHKVITNEFYITIDNNNVPLEDEARNLGLTMDSELNFHSHTNKLRQICFNKLRSLNKFKYLLPSKAKLQIADALILSNLNYCDIVYGPCLSVKNADRIQQIQNACIRFAFNIKRNEHVTPALREAKWLKMSERRKVHSLSSTHRIIKTNHPKYLRDKLLNRTDIHHVNTRNKNKLHTQLHRTSKFQGSFRYNAPKLYNSIPDEFKHLNLKQFKDITKKYISQEAKILTL